MKAVLIVFISFAFTFSVYSQSNFEIGISTGTELNFASSYDKNNIYNYEAIPGFNMGLRLKHNWGIFSLIGGIEYARMYFSKKVDYILFPTEPMPERVTLVANQIRLPILFQVNVGKKRSQFFANIGPCFLITVQDGLDRSSHMSYDDMMQGPQYPDFPSSIVQPYNMGGMLGSGYSYKVKDWFKLFSEVRLMIPFVANPGYTTNLNNTARTLNLSLQFGVSFLMHPPIKLY